MIGVVVWFRFLMYPAHFGEDFHILAGAWICRGFATHRLGRPTVGVAPERVANMHHQVGSD